MKLAESRCSMSIEAATSDGPVDVQLQDSACPCELFALRKLMKREGMPEKTDEGACVTSLSF